jgi:hypothetical protein
MTDLDDDEDYFLPVQDQRVFGAGIKRKKINFVPASTPDSCLPTKSSSTKFDIASHYLSIVLPDKAKDTAAAGKIVSSESEPAVETAPNPSSVQELCPVCKQPLTAAKTAHESSISHQLCLEHVQPPSHLPRDHIGVRYLAAHGWDPDARKGLGVRQTGIAVPIKAKEKYDTIGLKETEKEEGIALKKKSQPKKEVKVVKMNAKEMKLSQLEAKKRAEKLRQNFYGPDLEKYLGPQPP